MKNEKRHKISQKMLQLVRENQKVGKLLNTKELSDMLKIPQKTVIDIAEGDLDLCINVGIQTGLGMASLKKSEYTFEDLNYNFENDN